MRAARNFLIFCFGFFSISAQSLLFREYITTFEGNDIGVGIFFGSWLLWVGAGALVVYCCGPVREEVRRRAALFLLGYILLDYYFVWVFSFVSPYLFLFFFCILRIYYSQREQHQNIFCIIHIFFDILLFPFYVFILTTSFKLLNKSK